MFVYTIIYLSCMFDAMSLIPNLSNTVALGLKDVLARIPVCHY